MGHFWVNEDASKIAPLGITKHAMKGRLNILIWGQRRVRKGGWSFFFLCTVGKGVILKAKLVLDPGFMFYFNLPFI